MKILLETERLILREFTADDLQSVVELDSDPDVMRFIASGKPTPRKIIEQSTLPKYLEYHRSGSGFGYWVVIEKSSGDFMGWFHLRPNRNDQSVVELGYRLGKKYWGRGYATEGSKALIQYGFDRLNLEQIFAHAIQNNAPSIRVMEKIGMRFIKQYQEERFSGDDKTAVQYLIQRNPGGEE
jgi:RimJ/RimL family protein N-acetyltransferase